MNETILTLTDFVNKYNSKNGLMKGGSLCFYGHWFGRPYDNYHKLNLVTFDTFTNTLTFTFDEKETLSILNPKNISEFGNKLTIDSADRVYWEWFSYGNPYTKDNLYHIEITRQDDSLTGQSNEDWYKPNFKDLSIKKPALLWVS